MKNINYPIIFKIYTDFKKIQFYTVVFCKTQKEMYKYYKNHSRGCRIRKLTFEAICISWEIWNFKPRKNKKRKHEIDRGLILFHKNFFGAEVVSHEATHAAIAMAYNKDLLRNRRHEEAFCRMQGWLTRQIWNNYYEYFDS